MLKRFRVLAPTLAAVGALLLAIPVAAQPPTRVPLGPLDEAPASSGRGARLPTDPSADQRRASLAAWSPTGATNSDLAFWGDLAAAGNYNGFRLFDISTSPPTLVADVACFGPQNDVSLWDRDGNGAADILFLSIDRTLAGPDCGAPAVAHDDPAGWEGLRIFDISNPAEPAQIGAVYQDCGSHTHTLVPDPSRSRVLLYNSSYPLRPGPTCGPVRGPAAGRDPLHGVIQVVEVAWDPARPLDRGRVEAAEVAERPINYPGDPDNKFDPAEHALPGFLPLRACHDIAVFVELHLAAAACAEQGQLWRIDPATLLPDTANPLWVFDNPVDENGATSDPNDPHTAADFWHSATFTWDGQVVNFSDESFGDGCPPVTPGVGDTGRTYFLRVSDGVLLSQFMIPRRETDAYCSTHQGNVVPAPGRYLLAQAWYMGGVDVIDFTDLRQPREVAFFDFNPDGEAGSDNWSYYWYERTPVPGSPLRTYGQDGVHHPPTGRGFEVFDVAVGIGARAGLDHLNPQTQERVIR